jgi:hypothetical protein
MAALGNAREGFAMLTKGLSTRRAAGAEISTPQALMLFDEAYARLGQPVERLNCLAEVKLSREPRNDTTRVNYIGCEGIC